MDSEIKCRSLPPLVEGKIHGYLKLVIDEVIWAKKSPGEIKVFASWWGESDSAEFRPADITKNGLCSETETTEIYTIRTNINLFKDYIQNCGTIELIVVAEKTNSVLGTSRIIDLFDIFTLKPCFKYFPVLNNVGQRIGELHVCMKLLYDTKSSSMQLKAHKQEKKLFEEGITFGTTNTLKYNQEKLIPDCKDSHINESNFHKNLKFDDSDIYKSILKSKRSEIGGPLKKFNEGVTDKLVAQVVARAQRLRGAILKETYNDDPLALSDNSLTDGLATMSSPENEAKMYEYFLGKDMTSFDERKVLSTLRSMSPTPSLIDFASKSISSFKCENTQDSPKKAPVVSYSDQETSSTEKASIKSKDSLLLNHVDCIRIFVESFALTPAGYRRVKSSSVSRNESNALCVTYFVQYDTAFNHLKQTEKAVKENKPIRICSKKQVDQVIHFNHDGIYSISRSKVDMDCPIKFKVFVRHLNQKSPTELGVASMFISDITKTENWSITQRLAVVNKGMKIGELNVTTELGSDFAHFGKQYVDGIMSTKENIPILETQSLLSTRSNKSKTATGTQSKTSSRVSSISAKEVDCLTADNNTNLRPTKDVKEYKKDNVDDKRLDTKNRENNFKDKTLLHGLIYVAEGKDLPELNTYLICRAFWKEDKTTSQICSNTNNPLYHFFQLVPLLHDNDLLDRIKDNYIIIEVYCKNKDGDNLLGLAKLSVHQLYVAYKDPLVLPHLLMSKYPVISVDGWVPIINPITGQYSGQLLALVALGTAEQIALLEMSRGLRNISVIPQTLSKHSNRLASTQYFQNPSETLRHTTFGQQQSVELYPSDNNFESQTSTTETESLPSNYKTQECQTDISTLSKSKFTKRQEDEHSKSESQVLHTLVDRLAEVLSAGKTNIDQSAQTEADTERKQGASIEEQMRMNEMNLNNISDDSDSCSLRNNFPLPTEMYRSVGVGAEYDEELDQQQNTGYTNTDFELPIVQHVAEKEQTDSECANSTFRAVIEIECALHLPKVERVNEAVEPSTYVSFQSNKIDFTNQLKSFMVTNVFPRSCNPKWNWKHDTRLSTELLLNDEKRLILKIWRLLDPDISMEINLERDIVIGFSAIDLSVLVTGFPTISGWFHIMDFTGKCNGQIKVSITPLDNLSSFGKSSSALSTTRIPVCNVSRSSWSPVYSHELHPNDMEPNNVHYTSSTSIHNEDKSINSESQLQENVVAIDQGLEDVSLSFLSTSLKQTLSELDEITKRLESRLRDVTNTAFEDEFENEFDLNEPNSDNENSENRNIETAAPAVTSNSKNKVWQAPHVNRRLHDAAVMENRIPTSQNRNQLRNYLPEFHVEQNRITSETGNIHPDSLNSYSQSLLTDNYQAQQQTNHCVQDSKASDNIAEHPARGTKMHINHLLDKLSLQLPARSLSSGTIPMRRNIIDLLANLQQNNNNHQNNSKCNREVKLCTVPTQTDDLEDGNVPNTQHPLASPINAKLDDAYNDTNLSQISSNSQASNRISNVIREELVAEENSDGSKCDELSSYLITSNVRHMDLDNMFNPLLYPHLVPDLRITNNGSPEDEAVEQLDNRYAKTFSNSIDNRLRKVQNLVEVGASSTNENNVQERQRNKSLVELSDNAELFRTTPSGVSENVDGNIDLTVVRKSSYNDLMASNSTESTTTTSLEKSPMKRIEIAELDNSYSTSSDISVPALSRQAPDGGNPIEDVAQPLTTQQNSDSQDSSLSS